MIKRILIFCLILFATSAFADQNTHYDDLVSDLTSSGHLVKNVDLRSTAEIDTYCPGGASNCPNMSYNASEDAIKFSTYDADYLAISWSAISTGTTILQYETKFHVSWPYDTDMTTGKYVRTKSGSGDARLADHLMFHNRVTHGATSPALLLGYRPYDASYDSCYTSICVDRNIQPGGDTAADVDTTWSSSDHLADSNSPFLHLGEIWIRETYIYDHSANRVMIYISDENNDTVKVVADPENSSLGYYINTSDNMNINGIWFGLNISSGNYPQNTTDGGYDEAFHYHRNFIVAHNPSSQEITDFLAGRPGSGASQTEYYVDADAGGTGDGTIGDPYDLSQANAETYSAGDTVYFQKGDDFGSGTFTIDDSGASGNVITLNSYGSGNNPKLERLTLSGDYITATNLDIDGNKAAHDLVDIDGDNIILDNLEIYDGLRDGVDIGGGQTITIQNCTIHNLLNGTAGSEDDAHGITGNFGSSTVILSGNTIYQVSGDCVQFDPDRLSSGTVNITGDTYYTAALTSDFNGSCPGGPGWCTGDIPGENAIDQKSDNSDPYTNSITWNITNVEAYGFTSELYSRASSAFRLKEYNTTVMNRIKVHDCTRGFDISGQSGGNITLTIKNAIFYNFTDAIYVDEDIANLKIYNCTFGDSITNFLNDQSSTFTGEDLRNNAFLGTKPAKFSDSSNINGSSADFNNSANDDYTLSPISSFINHGETISGVIVDYAGTSRVAPYEVGAYEFGGNVSNNITFNNCIIK